MATTLRMPVGYYVMLPLGEARLIPDSTISNKNVSGVVLRQRWSDFNPAPDKFNYSYLEQQFTRFRKLKRKVILSIYTGTCSPEWVKKQSPFFKDAPYPFNEAMHHLHGIMVEALADHFGSDPLLSAVEISGPTYESNELHYAPGLTKVPGYSAGEMVDAWETCIDQYAVYFDQVGLLSCGGISGQGAKGPVTRHVFDYLLKEHPKRGIVSHCALKADTNAFATHHSLVNEFAARGMYAGFEMACNSVDKNKKPISRFGGKFSTAITLAKKSNARFYKVYQFDVPNIKLP